MGGNILISSKHTGNERQREEKKILSQKSEVRHCWVCARPVDLKLGEQPWGLLLAPPHLHLHLRQTCATPTPTSWNSALKNKTKAGHMRQFAESERSQSGKLIRCLGEYGDACVADGPSS
jgi:hypothetical protein